LCRKEHVQKFIDCQVKDVAKFEAERDELIKVHEEKKMRLKKEYMEKELDAALTSLMEKHKLRPPARKGASAATLGPQVVDVAKTWCPCGGSARDTET